MRETKHKRRGRTYIGFAAVLVASCAGLGAGAYALFSDTDQAAATVEAGAVNLNWAGIPAIPVSLPVGPLGPGGTFQRHVDLQNTGTVSVAELQLAFTATPGNPAANLSDGIQFRLETCSVPWAGTPQNTNCPGLTTEISSDRPATGRTTITDASSTAVGGTDHLKFTFRLPESSANNAQNTTDTINFVILGNQRPGQHQ